MDERGIIAGICDNAFSNSSSSKPGKMLQRRARSSNLRWQHGTSLPIDTEH